MGGGGSPLAAARGGYGKLFWFPLKAAHFRSFCSWGGGSRGGVWWGQDARPCAPTVGPSPRLLFLGERGEIFCFPCQNRSFPAVFKIGAGSSGWFVQRIIGGTTAQRHGELGVSLRTNSYGREGLSKMARGMASVGGDDGASGCHLCHRGCSILLRG